MDLARAMQPLAYLLAPVLIYQGNGLKRRIPRLPEAADPAGTTGDGSPRVRLAVFGDSTAAGTGAKRHQDALAGMLAAAVAAQVGREVSWRAVARSGATSQTARDLVPKLIDGDWRPDVVVVLIGVNDLKNLRPLRAWDHDIPALLAAIDETTGSVPVIVSGMAPVSRFPALPQPMRAVLALRARTMDHTLHRAVGDRHVPVNPQMIDRNFFAEDGFHPSSQGYRTWAGELADPVARTVAL
ncbi:MAG: SGNH/GDSL hydrolase family protein [Nocardiopsaceae bacterium]|nr:SGNH/GDSL hydrolase family protein [Nocardiopsaceae bacterium]